MDELWERELELEEIAARLNGIGVDWAVFAGAAAVAYGVDRPITDVDILVPAAAGERVVEVFPEAEVVRGESGTILGLRLAGYDILAGLERVDLDQEMVARLRYRDIEGVRVPVIPVEDNIALKAVWGRGAGEGKRDWEDVEGMMVAVEAVDWGYLRSRLGRLASRERAQELLDKLETLGARIGTRSGGGVQIT